MKIESIFHLKNFKAFKDIEIPNIPNMRFCGRDGAGKTTLF